MQYKAIQSNANANDGFCLILFFFVFVEKTISLQRNKSLDIQKVHTIHY